MLSKKSYSSQASDSQYYKHRATYKKQEESPKKTKTPIDAPPDPEVLEMQNKLRNIIFWVGVREKIFIEKYITKSKK